MTNEGSSQAGNTTKRAASPGVPARSSGIAAPRPRPTPVEWLLLLAGLVLTNHYAWLMDDSFVVFRYVDNWVVHGLGLVYNQGEYVEGFTSPAWLLPLAPLRATGLDFWQIVRLIGIVAFALIWWMLVVLNRDLSPEATGHRDAVPVVNFPLAYLALNYAVLCYFTSGLEAPLVQICAIAYALHLVRPDRFLPTLAVGVSPLIRPELALALAISLTWTWSRTRRPPWRLAAIALVGVGGWFAFRVVYYADLLPNTFYLKDLNDWRQGLVYLHQTLATWGAYPVALGFAGLALSLRRRGVPIDGAPRLGMLLIAAAIALYFVRVGGDARHYRYLAFSFCLATGALAGLAERGLATFMPRLCSSPRGRWAAWMTAMAVALVVFSLRPPQLGGHPIRGRVSHTKVQGINDAAYHRNHPSLAASPWSPAPTAKWRPGPIEKAGQVQVASVGWCETAYRHADKRIIHNLGLTDAILARVDLPPTYPGHKKGLDPMARQMRDVHRRYQAGPGMYRSAVEDGVAAAWMAKNLASIEILERKIYNHHRPIENLRLALAFPPRIQP